MMSLFRLGDYGVFINNLESGPAWPWQVGFAAMGLALYGFALWVGMRDLAFLCGTTRQVGRAAGLTIVPYLAGGIFNTLISLRNPMGLPLVVMSAVAGSFGGTAGLFWLPFVIGNVKDEDSSQAVTLPLQFPWLVAAAIVVVTSFLVLGAGMDL
jgi:hypothetical protein